MGGVLLKFFAISDQPLPIELNVVVGPKNILTGRSRDRAIPSEAVPLLQFRHDGQRQTIRECVENLFRMIGRVIVDDDDFDIGRVDPVDLFQRAECAA